MKEARHMRLKGKTAVITGSSSGIGRATAILFAREGALVVCVDVDEKGGRETVETINQYKQKALFIQTDVSNVEEVQRMAQRCEKSLKQVDILFNNAGYAIWQGFEATTEDTWSKMVGTNLTGVFLCSKYLLPLIKVAGGGSIINNASIDGLLGNPQVAAYSASKGGIIPLTHVMAHDLAKYNIRVNCLCTGGIDTAITDLLAKEVSSEALQKLVTATPMKRMGTPDEVANTVLFLASDESSFVNGSTLVVDGGRTAITPGFS
jgi:NAD(P)-dependent dehydrogenase (short-subunit alcohol dehydrogenase family)